MADASLSAPKAIYLKDYQPPSFLIKETELWFDLHEDYAKVRSRLVVESNMSDERQLFNGADKRLVLHGEDMELLSVKVDEKLLIKDKDYRLDDKQLILLNVDACERSAVVEIENRITPQKNFSFEGLYRSNGKFCTQCEAEGFRKITYFIDRPDVLSIFTVHIEADRKKYPVLLSNGNRIRLDKSQSDRHSATWHDPFPKPAYLFALVAGTLSCIEDSFTTMSGRQVVLQIFVEQKDTDKCEHAMLSLKKAMRWDEQVYGREYDLNIFMIVAVDDFNMGAMENKGLNIFNTSCVLANTKTTTDAEFERVEAVVAHEYFHNWSGNRVTCRDWFQLSLKEGFTVFRDSEFSSDMGSRIAKRIEDATVIRTLQFAEDSGPMSHQVQPDSFIEISNFYTLTIYEKGAEIVRMIHTILGAEKFRDGSDLYFERYDGQAVTIDDFISAMEDASKIDLTQFKLWYKQAGTPTVKAKYQLDKTTGTLILDLKQTLPNNSEAKPFVIPIRFGLVHREGPVTLALADSQTHHNDDLELVLSDAKHEAVILLKASEANLRFQDVPSGTVPSILRDFSAPVKLQSNLNDQDLACLTAQDADDFNRWDASQELACREIEYIMGEFTRTPAPKVRAEYFASLSTMMEHAADIKDWRAEELPLKADVFVAILMLPSEDIIHSRQKTADVDLIYRARERVRQEIANHFSAIWTQIDDNIGTVPAEYGTLNVQLRGVKQICLYYLAVVSPVVFGAQNVKEKLSARYYSASNMTEALGVFREVIWSKRSELADLKQELIQHFFEKWQDEALVVNNWFSAQATCPDKDGVAAVKALIDHPAYDRNNPNKIRSVIGAFTNRNHIAFHRLDGKGYQFLADQIADIDQRNPQIASRLMTPFTKYSRYDDNRKAKMRDAVKSIIPAEGENRKLSKDLYEVVTKTLDSMV